MINYWRVLGWSRQNLGMVKLGIKDDLDITIRPLYNIPRCPSVVRTALRYWAACEILPNLERGNNLVAASQHNKRVSILEHGVIPPQDAA